MRGVRFLESKIFSPCTLYSKNYSAITIELEAPKQLLTETLRRIIRTERAHCESVFQCYSRYN